MYERLDFWREQVAATVPIPAVVGAHSHAAERLAHAGGDLVDSLGARAGDAPVPAPGHVANAIAHVREHAAGLYARTFDPTPLAGARPGAVAAAVAGCIAVGSGASYCVDRNVDLGSITRLAGISAPADEHHRARHHTLRAHVAQVAVTTTAIVPAPPPPPATATQVAPPPPSTQPTPPPAPEDEFQPTSAGATASPTTATSAQAPTPKPKRAPANGAPEFGGP